MMLCVSVVAAYSDLFTDLYVVYIFFQSDHIGFCAAQVAFFVAPSILIALGVQPSARPWNMNYGAMSTSAVVMDVVERLATILQLRVVLEAGRSLLAGAETPSFAVLKVFEAIFEAGPSAILQLYIILQNSEIDIILSISTMVSLLCISDVLYRMFTPNNSTERYNVEQVSQVLRFLFHFMEVVLVFSATTRHLPSRL
jgi:hypothetical protein